jgi:chromosome segregation ATPase
LVVVARQPDAAVAWLMSAWRELPVMRELRLVLQQLDNLFWEIRRMSDALQGKIDQLTADVSAQGSVIQSAEVAFESLAERLKAALDHATSTGATPEQLAKLEELHADLTANSTALAHAVAANTPADEHATDGGGADSTGGAGGSAGGSTVSGGGADTVSG